MIVVIVRRFQSFLTAILLNFPRMIFESYRKILWEELKKNLPKKVDFYKTSTNVILYVALKILHRLLPLIIERILCDAAKEGLESISQRNP